MARLLRSTRSFSTLAAVWAFLFAAMNLYWGLGGTFGIETLGDGIVEMARAQNSELMLINWISVSGKIAIGLLALASLRPWSSNIERLIHFGLWLTGVLLTLYAVGNFIQHALMLTGTTPVARLLGSPDAVRWHLFLWDPAWLLGGILFLLTANQYRKTKRAS